MLNAIIISTGMLAGRIIYLRSFESRIPVVVESPFGKGSLEEMVVALNVITRQEIAMLGDALITFRDESPISQRIIPRCIGGCRIFISVLPRRRGRYPTGFI